MVVRRSAGAASYPPPHPRFVGAIRIAELPFQIALLIAFLHHCWDREEEAISTTPELTAFLTLLTAVVSRGDSAAIALRDRVLGSAAA